jgi:prostaglandin-H2 D-isomerase / glutathione transferase
MSKPKLTYFDAPISRGEECRLALHVGGTEFEDVRITRDQWAELKPKTPFGSMPLFELPGHPVLAQSNAILVLVGRRNGLHPKDDVEAARHEAILQYAEDLRAALTPSLRMSDEADKKAARGKLSAEYLPAWAGCVERQIEGPFFAGSKIHVVDVKLFVVTRWITGGTVDHIPTTVFSAAPKLLALADAVASHERVKDWYARK